MAVEKIRGCGYRKVGGLYMVCDGLGEPCERLPIAIKPCVTCGSEIKQTRAFQWIVVDYLLSQAVPCEGTNPECNRCPVCTPALLDADDALVRQVGLTWIGEQFYPTPGTWLKEAETQGVSRRIGSLPRGFKIGQTWILVSHPTGIYLEMGNPKPGIIHAFKPSRLELIGTPKMRTEDWVKEYEEKGVTLVEVPEGDPDHMPTKKKKTKRHQAVQDLIEFQELDEYLSTK